MKPPSLFFLSIAASSLAYRFDHPVPPTLTLLFSANLTLADPIVIGSTPFGGRLIVSITDGSFSGPKLEGKVSLGLVSSLTSSRGTQIADATYVLEMSDAANIVITERAVIPLCGGLVRNWQQEVRLAQQCHRMGDWDGIQRSACSELLAVSSVVNNPAVSFGVIFCNAQLLQRGRRE